MHLQRIEYRTGIFTDSNGDPDHKVSMLFFSCTIIPFSKVE